MSDLFSSLVAVQPGPSSLEKKQVERIRGISPTLKGGLFSGRTVAPVTAPATGHEYDGNTFALYRMNEMSVGFTYTTQSDRGLVVQGMGIDPNGRIGGCFDLANTGIPAGSGSDYLYKHVSNTDGAADLTAWRAFFGQSNLTVEGWFNVNSNGFSSFWGSLFSLGILGNGGYRTFELIIQDAGANYHFEAGLIGQSFSFQNLNDTNTYLFSKASVMGSWHHFAYVRSGGNNHHIYIDGVKVAKRLAYNTPVHGSDDIFFLGAGPGTTNNFNGKLDDFRFSNVARSDAEVLASYKSGSAL
jgi:hypothetical protein